MSAGGEIPAEVRKWNGFGYLGARFTLGKAQKSEKYRQEEKGRTAQLAVFILRGTWRRLSPAVNGEIYTLGYLAWVKPLKSTRR